MGILDKIYKLGNPKLYEKSTELEKKDLDEIKKVSEELHELLLEFRKTYGAGRAIAAPQIGFMKRLIYMNIDKPIVLINPVLFEKSKEMMEVWDDCMCFPELLVKVFRHRECKIKYLDLNWEEKVLELKDDLSELLQHEYDHLDGVLAVQRAIDEKSFSFRSELKKII